MKAATSISLIVLTFLFWYGVYSAVGMWVFVFMLGSALTLIGLFYRLTKN